MTAGRCVCCACAKGDPPARRGGLVVARTRRLPCGLDPARGGCLHRIAVRGGYRTFSIRVIYRTTGPSEKPRGREPTRARERIACTFRRFIFPNANATGAAAGNVAPTAVRGLQLYPTQCARGGPQTSHANTLNLACSIAPQHRTAPLSHQARAEPPWCLFWESTPVSRS